MFRRPSFTRRARCVGAILCVASIFAQGLAQTRVKTKPVTNATNKSLMKAQVMVLGIYHFPAKNDVYNAAVDNMLSKKRQAELADLIARLREFKPTKIIIEAPYGDLKQNEHLSAHQHDWQRRQLSRRRVGFRVVQAKPAHLLEHPTPHRIIAGQAAHHLRTRARTPAPAVYRGLA